EMPTLRDRTLDLLFARLSSPDRTDRHDLDIEVMFHDHLLLVAGAQHPLAQRRKIKFEDLAREPWLLVPSSGWNTRVLRSAFNKHGLALPRASLFCYSFHLRATMLTESRYITAMPYSAMLFATNHYDLKILPVELPYEPWPLGVVRLK